MPRTDLLALNADDVTALTNRGTANRARRDVDENLFTFQLTETDAGEVTFVWSDGPRCTFPAGKTAREGACSCPATSLCRHLMRSVFAYQAHHRQSAERDPVETPGPVLEPWDPGTVSDDELARHYKKPALAAAARRFQKGVLVELVRSAKPTARFHQFACTLRFAVPHDVRYAQCDCAEPAPCGHVPLAVWAFRRLAVGQTAGVVATQESDPPVPADVLDAAEAVLAELASDGAANLPAAWKDRTARLEKQCQSAGLVWPAEIVAELAQQVERYAARDARFEPVRLAELTGELLIRCDAIRSATRAVPQLMVRGAATDRATDIGSARYIGLGCGVVQHRHGVAITAYLQDIKSGTVSVIDKDFPDPPGDSAEAPREYWRLAQSAVRQNVPLAAVGAGELLLQGGRRAADHRLGTGRARAGVSPQTYAWESLHAPVLAADFGELRARLGALPPASLRPRYVAEDLHVVPVEAVEASRFNRSTQAVEVLVKDGRGESALVRHPYTSRGAAGVEALGAATADESRRLRFVAGQCRLTSAGLEIAPTMLVFELRTAGADRPTRTAVQPWVERPAATSPATASAPLQPPDAVPVGDPVAEYPRQLLNELGDLLLLGTARSDARTAARWAEVARQGEATGYDRLARAVAVLAEALRQQSDSVRPDTRVAAGAALKLTLLVKLAQDVTG